jgi:hypothetical protein
MEKQTQTIADVRLYLFKTGKYAVIGSDEYTNQEARFYLYKIDNQGQLVNVIDNGTHLLIWGV